MQDIHDLKPLLGVAFPWLSLIAVLMLLAGLSVLAIWLWRKRRKRPKSEQPAPAAPRPNAREQALRALKNLKPDPHHPGQFYLQLEHLLKLFLEQLHQAPVTGFTAQELVAFLHASNHPSLADARVEQLLLHGQQAKFAAGSIELGTMEEDLKRVIGFVKSYSL